MKRQGIGWHKILAKHMSDRRLESRINKELLQFSNKRKVTQFINGKNKINKWGIKRYKLSVIYKTYRSQGYNVQHRKYNQ